jgi:ATP-dependent RNA helicase RhlE
VWEFLGKHGIEAARIHGNRSQAQRTDALDGFKSGRYRVLVATDIAARGIDVEALGHVVNFDVPVAPEDYIHRVGRTARAEATGEAFTFASPDEGEELRAIERAIGKALPRVTLPDFDYTAKPTGKLEVPLAERIAALRAKRADDRARAKAKEERRAAAAAGGGASRPASKPAARSGAKSARPAGQSASRAGSAPASSAEGAAPRRRRRRRGGGGRGTGGGA